MIKILKEKWAAHQEKVKHTPKEDWKGFLKSFLLALLLAMTFRTFLYEPFHIPSGSMKPNLLIGDYIFVSKFSYGYSRYSIPFGPPLFEGRIWETLPKRGDIVVFKQPGREGINFIKRLIGLPGDRIQVTQGVLYINGEPVPKKQDGTFIDSNGEEIDQYIETLDNGVSYRVLDDTPHGKLDNTDVYVVPEGHYFFLGDNRDNSQDSRVLSMVGYVPKEHLVGRAEVIFFSSTATWWKVWTWFTDLNPSRFLSPLH